MKRIALLLFSIICVGFFAFAHPINSYKYVFIESQEDMPKDIEERLNKEFAKLGFIVLNNEDYDKLGIEDKGLVLNVEYRCRQSAKN